MRLTACEVSREGERIGRRLEEDGRWLLVGDTAVMVVVV